jgi:hypothetical protein
MKQIALNGKHGAGKFALVDDEDYEELMQYKWLVHSVGYAIASNNGKSIYMHRHILKPKGRLVVDHINGNKLDNTRKNIRVCTHQQNIMNYRSNKGLSNYKGVDKVKLASDKWRARIRYNGQEFYLGLFDTELEAAKAYNTKAKELFGEFAHLNKI